MENITQYKKIFKYPIGYSDHSLGTLTPPLQSQRSPNNRKHFTINKRLKGVDHKNIFRAKRIFSNGQ